MSDLDAVLNLEVKNSSNNKEAFRSTTDDIKKLTDVTRSAARENAQLMATLEKPMQQFARSTEISAKTAKFLQDELKRTNMTMSAYVDTLGKANTAMILGAKTYDSQMQKIWQAEEATKKHTTALGAGVEALTKYAKGFLTVTVAVETARRAFMNAADQDEKQRRMMIQTGMTQKDQIAVQKDLAEMAKRLKTNQGELTDSFTDLSTKVAGNRDELKKWAETSVMAARVLDAPMKEVNTLQGALNTNLKITAEEAPAAYDALISASQQYKFEAKDLLRHAVALTAEGKRLGLEGLPGWQRILEMVGATKEPFENAEQAAGRLVGVLGALGSSGLSSKLFGTAHAMTDMIRFAKDSDNPLRDIVARVKDANEQYGLLNTMAPEQRKVWEGLIRDLDNGGKKLVVINGQLREYNKQAEDSPKGVWTDMINQLEELSTAFGDLLISLGAPEAIGKFAQTIKNTREEVEAIVRLINSIKNIKMPWNQTAEDKAARDKAMLDPIANEKARLRVLEAIKNAGQLYLNTPMTEEELDAKARGNVEGKRAGGGPVSGGKRYLVGEKGPEIFQPGSSGSILAPGGANDELVRAIKENTRELQEMNQHFFRSETLRSAGGGGGGGLAQQLGIGSIGGGGGAAGGVAGGGGGGGTAGLGWGGSAGGTTGAGGAATFGGGAGGGAAGGVISAQGTQSGQATYNKMLAAFQNSDLVGKVPPDGAKFGITTGSAQEWARFGTAVAKAESSFNPNTKNLSDPGGSFGILQYAHNQVPGGNAYDVNSSVSAFVRDAGQSVRVGSLARGLLGRRFSTIGSHPDRTIRNLANYDNGANIGAAGPASGSPGGLPNQQGPGFGGGGGAAEGSANRPNYYGGTLSLGGETFNYGTGGAGRGSTPYGSYPVNIRSDLGGQGQLGSVGQRIGSIATVGGRGGEINDPRYPGAPRGGIQIHSASHDRLDQLYTQGCFGIARSQWPRFRSALLREAAKGPLYLNINRNGQASIGGRQLLAGDGKVVRQQEQAGIPVAAQQTAGKLNADQQASIDRIYRDAGLQPPAVTGAPAAAGANATGLPTGHRPDEGAMSEEQQLEAEIQRLESDQVRRSNRVNPRGRSGKGTGGEGAPLGGAPQPPPAVPTPKGDPRYPPGGRASPLTRGAGRDAAPLGGAKPGSPEARERLKRMIGTPAQRRAQRIADAKKRLQTIQENNEKKRQDRIKEDQKIDESPAERLERLQKEGVRKQEAAADPEGEIDRQVREAEKDAPYARTARDPPKPKYERQVSERERVDRATTHDKAVAPVDGYEE